jgi:hypothetical protein
MPERATASLIAIAPRDGAGMEDKEPRNKPKGVRADPMIITSVIDFTPLFWSLS